MVAMSGSKSRTAALMPQNLSALKPRPYKSQLFRKSLSQGVPSPFEPAQRGISDAFRFLG